MSMSERLCFRIEGGFLLDELSRLQQQRLQDMQRAQMVLDDLRLEASGPRSRELASREQADQARRRFREEWRIKREDSALAKLLSSALVQLANCHAPLTSTGAHSSTEAEAMFQQTVNYALHTDFSVQLAQFSNSLLPRTAC